MLVPVAGGVQIPLGQLADIQLVDGPSMIRDENGFMAGYVYVDIAGRDVGGYVEEAKQVVRDHLQLPAGLRPAVERPVREHDPREASGSR